MNTLSFHILLFTIIIVVIVVTYILISKLLKYLFKKEHSIAEPVIKALTVLGAAYASEHELAIPLINVVIQISNQYIGTHIALINESKPQTNSTAAIIFYIIVGVIVVAYIMLAYEKRTIINQIIEEKEKDPLKIDFPKEEQHVSPIFHERIKTLFELKFERENLSLSYDKIYSTLYGYYTFGLHKHFILIYCDNTVDYLHIKYDKIIHTKKLLENIAQQLGYKIEEHILDYYYLVENGAFEITQIQNLLCYSENSFLDALIDFTTYLKKLVHRFNTDKLPFSSANEEDQKYTLSHTFIQPQFQVSNTTLDINLEEHIDTWLKQSNRKHIVLLGDYGMGKSTFMKYYANHLAQNILQKKPVERFPVFISLTNTSPRHGGIDNAIGKFVSDNLGVSRRLFDILVNSGKILFLLDGFDEMGYVGTHDQRIKQLNAIWQIATKNNKLIVSGRPSYFPTEKELNYSFNIKNISRELTPQENPYFEKINLEGFNDNQIKQSIATYNFSPQKQQKYTNFIFSNQSILDLCKRPSMMHIIREMLPRLYADHTTQTLNAGNLMKQYIDHWISRQLEKHIVSAIEDRQLKRAFVWDFFVDLASIYYLKGVEAMQVHEIKTIIKSRMQKLNLSDPNDVDGFETELLSGFFIEIEDHGYRFVHKSFKEFFIAQNIISSLRKKNFDHPIITLVLWSKEINSFVFDGFSTNKNVLIGKEKIPYLIEWCPELKKVKFLAQKYYLIYITYTDSIGGNFTFANSLYKNMRFTAGLYGLLFIDMFFLDKLQINTATLFTRSYYYCYLIDNSLIENKVVARVISRIENKKKEDPRSIFVQTLSKLMTNQRRTNRIKKIKQYLDHG